MGIPSIDPFVEHLIKEVFIDLESKNGSQPSAREVLVAATVKLQNSGRTDVKLAGLRKTQDILKPLRNPSGYEPNPLDEPWSMATLIECPINAAALLAVQKVWKLRLVLQQPLSCREASWVSRLYPLFEVEKDDDRPGFLDINNLDAWATTYSSRERLCERLGEGKLDTSDLDLRLVMRDWEFATALWTGIDGNKKNTQKWITSYQDSLPPGVGAYIELNPIRAVEEGIQSKSLVDFIMELLRKKLAKSDIDPMIKEVVGKYKDSLAILNQERSPLSNFEAEWVYSCWLIYITRGKKWPTLTFGERLDVVKRLRSWMQNHPWNNQEGPGEESHQWDVGIYTEQPEFKPSEILRDVGYSDVKNSTGEIGE
ncbi:MAG: hypothetical protein GY845_15070 [Planctomycetes bacterium]|nr:hypothetical protein [Planctomycetota bacterium]